MGTVLPALLWVAPLLAWAVVIILDVLGLRVSDWAVLCGLAMAPLFFVVALIIRVSTKIDARGRFHASLALLLDGIMTAITIYLVVTGESVEPLIYAI